MLDELLHDPFGTFIKHLDIVISLTTLFTDHIAYTAQDEQAEAAGVSGLWEGLEVKIGSSGFLAEEFARRAIPEAIAQARGDGRSLVYLGAGGEPAAG